MRCRIVVAFMLGAGACSAGTQSPADGDPAPAGMRAAADSSYGRTEQNPIKVGGARASRGPSNQRAYLTALRGPEGQELRFSRGGSCCGFKTKNATIGGVGLLDIYEVDYSGLETSVTLYLNMYDYETPQVPVGFTQAR